MLFTSYGFILFLVALFVVYYIIPRKYQWALLLGASYLFYALSGLQFLAYIVATTVCVYYAGRRIGDLVQTESAYLRENKQELAKPQINEYKSKMKARKRIPMLLALFVALGILAFVKYIDFAIANINLIARAFGSEGGISFWTIAVPLGISFYTFKSAAYLIDVYRGKFPPERNLFKFALFVSFFPEVIQGPISRFDQLGKTLYGYHPFDGRNVKFGLQRIAWGFFKKLVIADQLMVAVRTIIDDPDHYNGSFVLVGMLLYAFQLLADFSGGIDITIGIAQVLGVTVQENFRRPYFAKSITDYWRRWHISMGAWFRDYVFFPMSVSKPMLALSKFSRRRFGNAIGKRAPVYLATLTTWFATGIWHGSSWNFIAWGLANGVIILISQELEPFYDWFHGKFNVKHTFGFRSFQVVRTLLLMSSIRLFDCYMDVPLTFKMFGSMFTTFNYQVLFDGSLLHLGISFSHYVLILSSLTVVGIVSLLQRSGSVREKIEAQPIGIRYSLYGMLILSILVFGAYGVGYDAKQFIYNQF
ncbi:MBOAT family protein [Paenibacillus lupini]|uniref:MBOAT family O-acyltransferase n=1 Tax=Paenibacillus lupini TaxID=1450204 RepID=UPI00142405D1|nr:MBOAT family protein [Paenibacillus lupini]NIK22705.1 D-alanyl-lipoteichoic acid acyltransferase DltB (MBOAT superfamily) [Paenibacillus lupini]